MARPDIEVFQEAQAKIGSYLEMRREFEGLATKLDELEHDRILMALIEATGKKGWREEIGRPTEVVESAYIPQSTEARVAWLVQKFGMDENFSRVEIFRKAQELGLDWFNDEQVPSLGHILSRIANSKRTIEAVTPGRPGPTGSPAVYRRCRGAMLGSN